MFGPQLVGQIIERRTVSLGNFIIRGNLGNLNLVQHPSLEQAVLDQDTFGNWKGILPIQINVIAPGLLLGGNFGNRWHYLFPLPAKTCQKYFRSLICPSIASCRVALTVAPNITNIPDKSSQIINRIKAPIVL